MELKSLAGERQENSAAFTPITPVAGNEFAADAATLALIRKLRTLHRHSRLHRKEDFDRACFLIAEDDQTSAERYAAAFFLGAQLFGLKPLVFFNANASTVSADEMWLARLLTALRGEDYVSARYLLAIRVQAAALRRMMFLAGGLAEVLGAKLLGESGVQQESASPDRD